jgi:hypothetical protein
MRINKALILGMFLWCGCATGPVSSGVTLLAGIHHYRVEMDAFGARPERWPERQRMADFLKNTFALTVGPSKEFNRLVDIDLRKREFMIALRESGLRPERKKEIQDEIAAMNRDADGFKAVVRRQVMSVSVSSLEQAQPIETVATLGLLNLAIDGFSSRNNPEGEWAATTKVGPYVITDMGSMASVQTPEGRFFHCATYVVPEEGAGIKCEPVGGKS